MEHFIKHTRVSKERPVLLLLDNHQSSLNLAVLYLVKEDEVVLLTFPPHTSHKFVFGQFKKFVSSSSDAWLKSNSGKKVTIYDIPSLVRQALPNTVTPKNITSGFSVTRIWLFNKDIFINEDFFTCISHQDLVFRHLYHKNVCLRITPVLKQIKPFPKAGSCKLTRKRNVRVSAILTDTPVKSALGAEAKEREKTARLKLSLKFEDCQKRLWFLVYLKTMNNRNFVLSALNHMNCLKHSGVRIGPMTIVQSLISFTYARTVMVMMSSHCAQVHMIDEAPPCRHEEWNSVLRLDFFPPLHSATAKAFRQRAVSHFRIINTAQRPHRKLIFEEAAEVSCSQNLPEACFVTSDVIPRLRRPVEIRVYHHILHQETPFIQESLCNRLLLPPVVRLFSSENRTSFWLVDLLMMTIIMMMDDNDGCDDDAVGNGCAIGGRTKT
ncbi:hypothetical protein PR048_019764 [Dryococelus australis]|uniref:Transposase n=1 Tax=Dryococelus australis TaxID=614101 RepID=A0ABQ9H4Q3_9NEOP|nr:hypothetical protein PR048_019764 [Dryococelus australis]